MKDNRGVSLIELVVVMIILALIAAFAFYNGFQSIEKSEATELYVEMTNLMNAVQGVMAQREFDEGGEGWIVENGFSEDGDSGDNGWFNVYGMGDPRYETSNLRKKLNLDTIKRNYRVNYDTGEVELSTPVEVLGSYVRSYDSVRALAESNKI